MAAQNVMYVVMVISMSYKKCLNKYQSVINSLIHEVALLKKDSVVIFYLNNYSDLNQIWETAARASTCVLDHSEVGTTADALLQYFFFLCLNKSNIITIFSFNCYF